jgi:peptidoglycan-associated lipoprotein
MKSVAAALTQILLALALVQSAAACSSTKVAKKVASAEDEGRAAQVKELNALVAQGPLYFETDTDALTENSLVLLQKIAAQMHRVPRVRVIIAGNADERGDTAYNLSLGERRAATARGYLARLGIPKERVKIVSLGEEQPVVDEHGEEAWAQNRRDEFTFLMPGESKSVLSLGLESASGREIVATTSFDQE